LAPSNPEIHDLVKVFCHLDLSPHSFPPVHEAMKSLQPKFRCKWLWLCGECASQVSWMRSTNCNDWTTTVCRVCLEWTNVPCGSTPSCKSCGCRLRLE
jgi:hypothetical protein